jgi:hypothetical protein
MGGPIMLTESAVWPKPPTLIFEEDSLLTLSFPAYFMPNDEVCALPLSSTTCLVLVTDFTDRARSTGYVLYLLSHKAQFNRLQICNITCGNLLSVASYSPPLLTERKSTGSSMLEQEPAYGQLIWVCPFSSLSLKK